MINQQELNLAQLSSQSLEEVRVGMTGLDQTSALACQEDQLKALRTLELARQREALDWLITADDTALARPAVLTWQLTQL